MTELRQAKNDIWFNYTSTNSKNNAENEKERMPIIMEYNTLGTKLAQTYKQYLSNVQTFNNTQCVIAYKTSSNLKQILVRAKLQNHEKGSFRGCGLPNCKTCGTCAHDTESFRSTTYNKQFTLRQKLTCTSKNIIYLVTCTKCHLQYVGETGRTLRDRSNDHRSAIKLKKNTPIGIHFNSPHHSVLNYRITPIEAIKNTENATECRLIREAFWQLKLGSTYPKGLNGLPTNK